MGIDYSTFRKIPLYDENGEVKLVGSGEWKGYKFHIVTVGTHPNAYIELNQKEIKMPWERILEVHGGVTYHERSCHYSFPEMNGKAMVGWDYAHCCDYHISSLGERTGKKWTSDEIVDECVSVIEQIIKGINRNKN